MTLNGSGPLSIGNGVAGQDIALEFGLPSSTPFPSGFYGKGGAPSSGALAFSDFYGRSGVLFTPDGGNVSVTDFTSVSATLSCTAPATWTYTRTSGADGYSGANLPSGSSATSIIFGCNTTSSGGKEIARSASWTVSGTAGGVTRNFTVSLSAQPTL